MAKSTEFLKNLSSAISEERLAPFRREAAQGGELAPYARYFWNIALSESLYPCLQALEITLRNSLHEVISVDKGTEDWFEDILVDQDKPALEEIKNRLFSHSIGPVAGQIVANSDFGFWARLLNSRYENILWPRLLQNAFPFMPASIRTRKTLSKRLNRVRALRNRAFHYEPIWNDPHLAEKHEEMKETMAWINPAMLVAVTLFDRFSEVYATSSGHYETALSNYLR